MESTSTKTADDTKVTVDCGFLDEPLALACEAVALRDRLNCAKREHSALFSQREEAAYEGRDVFPQIRALEELPVRIEQLEQRARWIIDRGVETLNTKNAHRAGQEYIRLCDAARQAVEHFRQAWVAAQEDARGGAASVGSVVKSCNSKLDEIQSVLGGGKLQRVSYTQLPIPTIDAELLSRSGLLAALDRWLITLRP